MGTQIAAVPGTTVQSEQNEAFSFRNGREQFVEAPVCRNRSGRGVLTGLLLGAGMWAVILQLTGVIKL